MTSATYKKKVGQSNQVDLTLIEYDLDFDQDVRSHLIFLFLATLCPDISPPFSCTTLKVSSADQLLFAGRLILTRAGPAITLIMGARCAALFRARLQA